MKININSYIFLLLVTIAISKTSIAQTVNLNNRITSIAPTASVAQWHTSATPSSATLLSNANAVSVTATPTNYWAFFYDGTNNCYSPGSKVTLVKTTCPGNTFNLTTLSGAGVANLVWHTSKTPTAANRVTVPAQASTGTYYPFYYDALNDCYSPAGAPVIVEGLCSSATYSVDGYVFNDIDGMADNSISTNGTVTNNSGTNTHANGLGGINAILYNSSNIVVASVAVNSNGYYNFSGVPAGNYAVAINAYPGIVGNQVPTHILNPGWQTTGERIGIGFGNDGDVNGHSSFFNLISSNVYDVNFGIRTTPTPTQDCFSNIPYMPVNNGQYVVVNGITITPTVKSGSVAEGSQGVFGCTAAEMVTTSYALWGGYNSVNAADHGPANANINWSITYTFSQPINNLRILVGSMGALGNENLIVNLDGMPATIVADSSCWTTVNGNEIIGGVAAPYPNGSGTSVFTLSRATPFTTLTLSGAGGYNGLTIEFCSSSIVPAATSYSISGTVFNDANGITDGNVNGAPIGTTTTATVSQQLYANLLNSSNVVVAIVPISASNGTYQFSNIPAGNYTVQLSTIQGLVNSAAPATNLPSGWNITGEALRTTGHDGNPNQLLPVTISNSNLANANFGIQRPPNSDNKTQEVVLQGNSIPAGTISTNVSGTDAEDGILGAANTVVITTLPTNSTMIYDGLPVTVGQVIVGLDPALLSFTNITNGSVSAGFSYSFFDAAGQEDPTPATYTLNWSTPLSVTMLNFMAKSKGNTIDLNWLTTSELNNRGFEIERSSDAKNWAKIGFVASATERGNSSTKRNYNFTDKQPIKNNNFYRLRQVDADGRFEYSDVVLVKLDDNINRVTIHPNPAKDYITVSHLNGNEVIKIVDLTGKVVFSKQVRSSTEKISLIGLSMGMYSCIIINDKDVMAYKLVIEN